MTRDYLESDGNRLSNVLGVNPVESVPCAMVGHYENIFLKPKNFIFFASVQFIYVITVLKNN